MMWLMVILLVRAVVTKDNNPEGKLRFFISLQVMLLIYDCNSLSRVFLFGFFIKKKKEERNIGVVMSDLKIGSCWNCLNKFTAAIMISESSVQAN